MATMITTTPVISNWFIRMRTRALTFAFAGGASGGLAAPLLVWAISTYGWRSVLDWIGIGTLIVGIPISLIMRHRPEQYGYLPDGMSPINKDASGNPINHHVNAPYTEPTFTIREILKTRALWMLVIGMGLSGMVMSITVVMIIPSLESYGLSTITAGFAVMALAIGNVTGRLLLGFLADKMNKRNVLCFTYLMFSLGALSFGLMTELWHLAIFIPLYSLAHGGTVPVRFALLADYFGRQSYGSLVGITMTLTAGFSIIGPVFTGLVFDITGSYRPAFIIVGLLMIPTIPITLLVKPPAYKT
jgi:MFS family permease